MRLLIFRSVGRMKKQALKKEKKITKSRRIGGLKPQHHCRGAWKQQDKVPRCHYGKKQKGDTLPNLLCLEILLEWSFFRLRELVKVKRFNYVVFFL